MNQAKSKKESLRAQIAAQKYKETNGNEDKEAWNEAIDHCLKILEETE